MSSLEELATEIKNDSQTRAGGLQDNVFYVLEHPNYKRQFVNPSHFSWIAFFFSIIFYAYYKRWAGLVCIIGGFYLCQLFMNEALDYGEVHSHEEYLLWVSGILGLFTQVIAGWNANKGKLASLISKGYKVVELIKADNADMALAQFTEKQNTQKEQVPTSSQTVVKPIPNSLSVPKVKEQKEVFGSGIAEEIESFANLRNKGIITEEEFQNKKKALLDLQYEL